MKLPIVSEIDVVIKHLIKMELVFQLIFLYFLSLLYAVGQRHVPAWTRNGSDWGPASTLDLHSFSDRCFDQCDMVRENSLLSVSLHNF